MIEPGVVYTVTEVATGTQVAEVRMDDGGATAMVRWSGDTDFAVDAEALALLLFPDDYGVTIT